MVSVCCGGDEIGAVTLRDVSGVTTLGGNIGDIVVVYFLIVVTLKISVSA